MSYEFLSAGERGRREREHILAAPDVGEAVRRAAALLGVDLAYFQAKAIATAACSYADSAVHVRQIVPRERWQIEGFRTYLRQKMRHELLDTVTSQGFVPASLPRETVRYMADSFMSPEGGGREVPESAAWDSVVVLLEVHVRRPPVDRAAAVKAGILTGDGSP